MSGGQTSGQAQTQIQVMKSMLDSLNMTFTQLNAFLQSYGIEMYIAKVKLYMKESEEHKPIDEDCPDASLCIDYIVRVKCSNDYLCMKLKEQIRGEKKGGGEKPV